MRIQVFSKYMQLAQEGKVDFLSCPMHPNDDPATFPLYHRMDEEQLKVVLECYSCGYKKYAGLELYKNLIDKIIGVPND
jgi:hypothetical protein